MINHFFAVATGLFLGLSLTPALHAAKGPHGTVELISSVKSVAPGGRIEAGLRLTMEPGWHVYWKNAGDSGTPPTLTWTLPPGYVAGPIEWPYPTLIIDPPLANYGYFGEVILPIRLQAAPALRPGSRASWKARAEWLICRKECIPGFADLTLSLPVKSTPPDPDEFWAKKIEAARLQLPKILSELSVKASASGRTISLSVTPVRFDASSTYWFFPDEGLVLEAAQKQPVRQDNGGITLHLPRALDSLAIPQRLRGVLVSSLPFDENKTLAVTIDVPIAPSSTNGVLWSALLLAFAGGLILNIMPCVFPILAVKVMGLIDESQNPAALRRHALAHTLGILVSMWILAGTLFILRAGGQSLGWGFQLQSPAFVAILAGLVFLMGLNMLGVFQIGTGLVALGNVLPARGRLSSFVSGALAVVIATPCTAPFMGAALAVALTLTWGAALAVFTALALGFAAPTVILCLSPRLLKAMPKAGPWMESFKQAMSFPLFGTVVWLSWVFARQTSPEAAVRFWSGLLLLSIAAWLYGRWGQSMTVRRGRTLGMLGAMAAMTLGTTLLIVGAGVLGTRPQSLWPEWSEQAVDKARQEGKIVFVDFTAAWCVTCQVNERLVLSRSDVQADFAKRQVVTLKADWTSRDSRITETLSALGRSGVPVYVVYGHNAPPLILPTVLTPALIREALDKAEATRIK